MAKPTLLCEAAYIPHHDEDAHFICPSHGAMGIADGVGGFRRKGIDSGLYARKLMEKSKEAIVTRGMTNPLEILNYANNHNNLQGGATACLAVLDKNGILRVANLGDSGFFVARNGDMILQSTVQLHYINAPYFLGKRADGTTANIPSDADIYELPTSKGDLIVMGTDGFFGNKDYYESLAFIKRKKRTGLAYKMARWARENPSKNDDLTLLIGQVI